jgi:hypothetical protein
MKITHILALVVAAALSGCAGHSISYNGNINRYTIDRTGKFTIEPIGMSWEDIEKLYK